MNDIVDWYGCYGEGWRNEIVGEAFSHPAKFSRALIRRIYEHALERGWLVEGDLVVDPFAGVALGGLDAMFQGLHWIGMELEEKFAGLGQQNIDLWNRRYGNGMLPRWGTATLLRGDSRELVAVLDGARAEGIIASPPYTQSLTGGGEAIQPRLGDVRRYPRKMTLDETYGTDPANLGNMPTGEPPQAVIGSPPHGHDTEPHGDLRPDDGRVTKRTAERSYGKSDGQLAAMPEGDVDAVIGSPPYVGSIAGKEATHPELRNDGDTFRPGQSLGKVYGRSDGQLAAMPEGEFEAQAVVSSPPFESTIGKGGETKGFHSYDENEAYNRCKRDYIITADPDNLGNIQGDTFWAAARQIVEQCHQILAPGGVAVWVLKSFVRNKAIVDFPDQWRQMCEACGFETLEWIRAWLVEDRGAQYDLEGDLVKREVRRESFFRRLHRRKYPELSIDYEIVLMTRKVDHEH